MSDEEEFQEVTSIGECIISVNRKGSISIDCNKPVSKVVIDKSDLDIISGVSNDVEKN